MKKETIKKIELNRLFSSFPTKIEEIANRLPVEYQSKLIDEFKKRTRNGQKIRIYSDGCWDMFHYGHARQFEQIKHLYPNIELIVGVCSDKEIASNKGLFVMNDEERIESIRHCYWVDEVIFPAPWYPTMKIIEDLNIDFIAHDAIPYIVPEAEDCYQSFKEQGRFLPTLRTEGISTSDLLVRILKERDSYAERNLKKGYSREQLNLGVFDYLLIKLKGATKDVEKSFKEIAQKAENKIDNFKQKTLKATLEVEKSIKRIAKKAENKIDDFRKKTMRRKV